MRYYHQSIEVYVAQFVEQYMAAHPSSGLDRAEVEKIIEEYVEKHGLDGKSAYESWLSLGNTGTEEDFINSLKGSDVKISKIEPIVNGQRIYFLYQDNGLEKIDYIEVFNGKDGVSIDKVSLVDNVLTVTLSNGEEITAGTIVIDESKLKLDNFYTKDESDQRFVNKIDLDNLIAAKIQSMIVPVPEEEIRNYFKNLTS